MNMERTAPRNPWLKLVLYAVHGLQWSFIAVPLFFYLNLVALAIHAQSILGRWPRMSFDDPKGIPGLATHLEFVNCFLICCHFSVPVVLILAMLLKYLDPNVPQKYRLLAMVAAWVLLIILGRLDPGQIGGWYID